MPDAVLWIKRIDPRTGFVYYVHRVTGQSLWQTAPTAAASAFLHEQDQYDHLSTSQEAREDDVKGNSSAAASKSKGFTHPASHLLPQKGTSSDAPPSMEQVPLSQASSSVLVEKDTFRAVLPSVELPVKESPCCTAAGSPISVIAAPRPLCTMDTAAQQTNGGGESGSHSHEASAAVLQWMALQQEKASLESEIALHQGPVDQVLQSIQEEQDQLRAAQKALAEATTKAAKDRAANESRLNELRRSRDELNLEREKAMRSIAALTEQSAVLLAQQSTLGKEEAEQQSRREVVEEELSRAAALLRSTQQTLYSLRAQVALQEQEVLGTSEELRRTKKDLVQMKLRIAELERDEASDAALQYRPDFCPPDHSSGVETFSSRVMQLHPTSAPGEALSARIAELTNELATLKGATQAVFKSTLLRVQLRVLAEATADLDDLIEVWRPAIQAAQDVFVDIEQYILHQQE